MQITTSRKPSPRSRRFAKTLAGFLGVPYLTRGKSSLDPDEVWMLVVEDHGSPRGIVKRTEDREEEICFVVSSETRVQKLKRQRPRVTGDPEFAKTLAEFFGLEWTLENGDVRTIRVGHDEIEFVDCQETILRLKGYERAR